jgi:hypothetical protein
MTNFEEFRNYVASFKKGDMLTRHEIMAKKFGGMVTIDNYRNWFTKAGYLRWVRAGLYELVKTPSTDLTSRTLRKEAYPHYKNWYEYRNLKD